jgi:hypothetical protein
MTSWGPDFPTDLIIGRGPGLELAPGPLQLSLYIDFLEISYMTIQSTAPTAGPCGADPYNSEGFE